MLGGPARNSPSRRTILQLCPVPKVKTGSLAVAYRSLAMPPDIGRDSAPGTLGHNGGLCPGANHLQPSGAELRESRARRYRQLHRTRTMLQTETGLSASPAAPEYQQHSSLMRLTFEAGFVEVDLSLVLRLGGASSPLGSIDLIARSSLDIAIPL